MPYQLSGRFIECCNCKVVCPCWVQERPTEDHCAGFFAWTFDPGSSIEGYDVSDRHVVVVTVHTDRNRGGQTESVVFVDDRLDEVSADALQDAFAIDDEDRKDPIADLGDVLGQPIGRLRARISIGPAVEGGFTVRVCAGGQEIVAADTRPATFDGATVPLTLSATALDAEMGSTGGVSAHRTERLLLNVAALPGATTDLVGRSGMVGRFSYLDLSAALADS